MTAIWSQTAIHKWKLMEIFGTSIDVVFSDKDGAFMKTTSLKINGLKVFAQIIRHSTPDYQTHLVSS
jgi:hypothetical protein